MDGQPDENVLHRALFAAGGKWEAEERNKDGGHGR